MKKKKKEEEKENDNKTAAVVGADDDDDNDDQMRTLDFWLSVLTTSTLRSISSDDLKTANQYSFNFS